MLLEAGANLIAWPALEGIERASDTPTRLHKHEKRALC